MWCAAESGAVIARLLPAQAFSSPSRGATRDPVKKPSRPEISAGVVGVEDRRDRHEQDPKFAQPRPVFEIFAVISDALFVANARASADLPQASDAGANE